MNVDSISTYLSFNYSPADYIDQSWVKTMDHSDIIIELMQQEVGKQWASLVILSNFGLNDLPDFNFNYALKYMAVKPKEVLVQIIFHAGLILNHVFFRKIVRREEKKALESCLGKKPYQYAIKKAPLIAGNLPNIFSCPFQVNWSQPDELKKHVFRSGMRLLGVVFSGEPEGYKKRFLFNFPEASKEFFYAAGAEHVSADVIRLGSAVFKKLMKEFGS